MPGPMPPQGAGAPQPPQGGPPPGQQAPQKSGNPSQLLSSAMDNLMQVGEIMSQSKSFPQPLIQKYGQIVGALQSFVEKDLGSAQGQPQPGPKGPPGGAPQPMQAGGNPNAAPAPGY